MLWLFTALNHVPCPSPVCFNYLHNFDISFLNLNSTKFLDFDCFLFSNLFHNSQSLFADGLGIVYIIQTFDFFLYLNFYLYLCLLLASICYLCYLRGNFMSKVKKAFYEQGKKFSKKFPQYFDHNHVSDTKTLSCRLFAMFILIYAFTDFESPLVLFSWWRNKIS